MDRSPFQGFMLRNAMHAEKVVVWTVATLIFVAMLHTTVVLMCSSCGVPRFQISGLRALQQVGYAGLETTSRNAVRQLVYPRREHYVAHGNGQPSDTSTHWIERPVGSSLSKSRGYSRRKSASNFGNHLRGQVSNSEKSMSSLGQVRLTLARLRRRKGSLSHRQNLTQAVISAVGILGMFAAIVGVMLGLWLDEAVESDEDDDDGFSYWDVSDLSPHESAAREEQYWLLRSGECFYGD